MADNPKLQAIRECKKLFPNMTQAQLVAKFGCSYGTVVKALSQPSVPVIEKKPTEFPRCAKCDYANVEGGKAQYCDKHDPLQNRCPDFEPRNDVLSEPVGRSLDVPKTSHLPSPLLNKSPLGDPQELMEAKIALEHIAGFKGWETRWFTKGVKYALEIIKKGLSP